MFFSMSHPHMHEFGVRNVRVKRVNVHLRNDVRQIDVYILGQCSALWGEREGVYRPLACVGVVRILHLKVYDFPHTHRHFVGQWNSSNVHVDPLLAPYQQY